MSMPKMSSAAEQAFMGSLEESQMKQIGQIMNGLVERSFIHCVSNWRNRGLDKTEEQCIDNYVDKFSKSQQRVVNRLGEEQQSKQQQQQQQQQQQSSSH